MSIFNIIIILLNELYIFFLKRLNLNKIIKKYYYIVKQRIWLALLALMLVASKVTNTFFLYRINCCLYIHIELNTAVYIYCNKS